MGHFTYWRYSRPVSANFSTRSSPVGDLCSVRSSLGIPVGSRNWRVGSVCSFSPASGCETIPRLLTQQTSEAMHVQGNDGQSNRPGKSLSTFRPNAVEATVFKIVDGRLHSGVLTAHSSKGFTLFAVLLSLAEAALPGQDVVNKQFIKAGAVRLAVEVAIKTRSAEIRKQFLRVWKSLQG